MPAPACWAPILLLLLRTLQGMALGGEYGGAAIYVAEHAPADKRGLYTSFIQIAAPVGFLLCLVVVLHHAATPCRPKASMPGAGVCRS